MFVIIVVILAALPAILIAILGYSQLARAESEDRRQALVGFWLKAAVIIALPFALFSYWMWTTFLGVFLLLVPVFIAIFSLLLINWKETIALYQSDHRLIGTILLILAGEITFSVLLKPVMGWLLLLAPLAIAGIWAVFSRVRLGWLTILGWLLVLFLLLDASGLASSPLVYSQASWRNSYHLLSALMPMMAMLVAAILLWRVAIALQAGEMKRRWSTLLLVGCLALSVAAVTARSAVLVRATSRAAEDHLPSGILATGIIGGILLWFALGSQPPGVRRLGAAFLVLAPGLVMLAFTLGGFIDPLAITTSRAGRISTLIDEYHQKTGVYPPELDALTPGYATWIPGPLTGRGQVWCYQSGPGYYRLGYALFQRYYDWPDGTPFFEPYYAIEVPASEGQPPGGAWMCDGELDKLKVHGGL